MPDYSKGKVYKLVCDKTGLLYIGSTCEPTLARRLSGHVAAYKKYLIDNTNTYYTSFKVLENENYNIVLLENCPCSSSDELKARERFYIESLICVNKYIPLNTLKESYKKYYDNNKEKVLNKCKAYNTKHVKELNEYKKNKKLCLCGCEISSRNMATHKKSIKHQAYINSQTIEI